MALDRSSPSLSLSAWRILRKELIWIYEGMPGEQAGYPFSRDATNLAWLVLQGSISVESGGQSIAAHAGEWLLPTPNQRTQHVSSRAHLLSVKFTCAWPDGRHLFEYTPGIRMKAADFPKLEMTARNLKKHLGDFMPIDQATPIKDIYPYNPTQLISPVRFSKADELFATWLSAFMAMMEAIGEVPTPVESPDERLVHAIEAIQCHPFDEPFRDQAIAKAAGLSLPHLNRLFRQRFGFTPHQYFQEERLARALRALYTTAVSVKQLAYDLGFHSPSHFCRWFRERQHTSPIAYRRKAQLCKRSF